MADDTASLRCKFCGAPLDSEQVRSSSSYVTCEYCGTSQQRIDAQKYMQDMVNEVKSWVLASMPNGYVMGDGDCVAKHAVFVKDIAPKLSTELNSMRFGLMSVLGNCLIALPYRSSSSFSSQHTSERVYAFAERVKSISQLAGTQEDIDLVDEANTVSQTYALALNNVRLMGEEKDGKWLIMSKNFSLASQLLSNTNDYKLVSERFSALSRICDGFEKLLNGDGTTAYGCVRQGLDSLCSIKEPILKNSRLAIMYSPTDQEASIARTMEGILMFSRTMGKDAVKMMQVIREVVSVTPVSKASWSSSITGAGRFDEIFGSIASAISSLGTGEIPIAAGDGDLLVPMWEVDLRYTFVTGKLFSKKTVEVKEDLLICADFPIDSGCMSDPSEAITDIFREKPPSSIIDSWKGNEKSISSSKGVGAIQDSVAMGCANGRRIMVPLSTKREAEKLCIEYVNRKSTSDKRFKLSEPTVSRLIYVPFSTMGGRAVNNGFDSVLPNRFNRFQTDSKFIIG